MPHDPRHRIAVLQDLRGSFILDGKACVLKDNGLPDFENMALENGS